MFELIVSGIIEHVLVVRVTLVAGGCFDQISHSWLVSFIYFGCLGCFNCFGFFNCLACGPLEYEMFGSFDDL